MQHLLALPLALLFGRDLPGPAPAREPPPIDSATRAPGEPLALVSGGRAAPGAWLAVWRGDAWVCWRPGAGCWQRLDVAATIDVATLRAEFTGPSALVLGDRSEATWRIDQGDPTPRATAADPTLAPRPYACGPAGLLPVVGDGGLELAAIPCDAPVGEHLCVAPGRGERVRAVTGLRVRLGLELRILDEWRRREGAATATGFTLLATLGLGWDGGLALRRERADLQAQARPGLRALPALQSRGPLAVAEREALTAVLCGGAP